MQFRMLHFALLLVLGDLGANVLPAGRVAFKPMDKTLVQRRRWEALKSFVVMHCGYVCARWNVQFRKEEFL